MNTAEPPQNIEEEQKNLNIEKKVDSKKISGEMMRLESLGQCVCILMAE